MAAPVLTLPDALPLAIQSVGYSYAPVATGGTPPYLWSVAVTPNTGNWLRLAATSGALITGMPGTQEQETITWTVTDANNLSASASTTLWVLSDVVLGYSGLITSEHNQKPNFMQLVQVLTGAVGDVTTTLNDMPAAFDLNGGAIGAQLDVLGKWIGQSRIIPNVLATGYFGFSTLPLPGIPLGLQLSYGNLAHASQGGIFFGLQDTASSTTTLSDVQYITILNARIARNQSDGDLDDLEQALFDIFGVPAKVIDNGTLSLNIIVSAPVSPVDQALVTGLDILPRPAGIGIASITYVP